MKRLLSILFSLVLALSVDAKITVQLFTHAPSQRYVFTAWGHSELRVLDDEDMTDVLYSYGVFSFDDVTKFVYNFVKGDTDYRVEAKHCIYNGAIERVSHAKGVDLRVQTLDLTQEEALKLKNALKANADIEDWTYRYNFFYDNCATRPRLMMENSTGAEIDYHFAKNLSENKNKKSYRDLIHELLSDMEWYALGIDICLGKPCDDVPSDSLMMFLPSGMADQFVNATITDSLGTRKLVSQDIVVSPDVYKTADSIKFGSPTVTFWVLAFLVLLHTLYYGYKKADDYLWFDPLFFGAYGLVGVLVFFLQFISSHPCVMPNYNILWANPLLLCIPVMIWVKRLRPYLLYAYGMNIFFIIPDLIMFFSRDVQVLHPAVLPIMLMSLLRSYAYVDKVDKIKKAQKMEEVNQRIKEMINSENNKPINNTK